ncbi:hypothetical protein ACWGE0_31740 [Lentzea sp. NPDC054927]
MTAAYDLATQSELLRLVDDYDAIIRRFADDNGELPDAHAVDAAEIAHQLFLVHADQSEHWRRLSCEHREGRTK